MGYRSLGRSTLPARSGLEGTRGIHTQRRAANRDRTKRTQYRCKPQNLAQGVMNIIGLRLHREGFPYGNPKRM